MDVNTAVLERMHQENLFTFTAQFFMISFFCENGAKMAPKMMSMEYPGVPRNAPWPPKNAPKTHPRRNLDFSLISVACGNGSAPGPREVGVHPMVCDV